MSYENVIEGFRIQGRVIVALMLREARTRYGRRQAGYLWAFVEPVIHMSMFALIFTYAARPVPLGSSMPVFLSTGVATFLGFRNVMGRTQGAYGSNEALLSFPVVKVLDCFIGRAMLELATWIAVTFIIMGTLLGVGEGDLPRNALLMLIAIFALASIGFGVGICLGIISQFLPSVDSLLKIPLRLVYFLSAVFYLPDQMPPPARDVLEWNPILHGITLFRMGYYQLYESHMFSGKYLAGWAAGSLLTGLLVERIFRKPLRSRS